jgi:hypothetical protein
MNALKDQPSSLECTSIDHAGLKSFIMATLQEDAPEKHINVCHPVRPLLEPATAADATCCSHLLKQQSHSIAASPHSLIASCREAVGALSQEILVAWGCATPTFSKAS